MMIKNMPNTNVVDATIYIFDVKDLGIYNKTVQRNGPMDVRKLNTDDGFVFKIRLLYTFYVSLMMRIWSLSITSAAHSG